MILQLERNAKGTLKCPFISKLYNITQDVKRISEEYYIDLESGCILYNGKRSNIVGDHLTVISNLEDVKILRDTFGDNSILIINSDAVYGLFKTYKKDMVMLDTAFNGDKMCVEISDKEMMYIGRLITPEHPNFYNLKNNIEEVLEFHGDVVNHINRFTELNDTQVERICESIFKCVMSDYHVRLTKQTIPGINGKFPIRLFIDKEREEKCEEETLCRLYINQERSAVSHFHIYRIIKY